MNYNMKEYVFGAVVLTSVFTSALFLYVYSKNEKSSEKIYIRYINYVKIDRLNNNTDQDPKNLKNKNLEKSDKKFIKHDDQSIEELSMPFRGDDGSVFNEIVYSIINHPERKSNPTVFINTNQCLGFRGIGIDHATTFHMLIIPKRQIRYFNDLKKIDLELLEHMKYVGECWVEKNKRYLDSIDSVNKHNIQFGFHLRPKIGYLSMHMLVGPLSKEADSFVYNWVGYDQVVDMIIKYDL